MEPCVSIIVPIYNAENYIRRCIDSILNQEFADFELILANDGSTDASGAICDEYAGKDPRIHIIHKKNTGVSDTRNLAIAQARGTYLQFLDSDDWITPDATKLLVRAASEYHCDMVIADFYRVVGDRVSPKGDIQADGVMTREEFAAFMMENPADFYYGVLWNKLFRRDLVETHHLKMDTNISWCEDFLFNLEYLLHAETFYALQTPIYYYVKRKGSLAAQGLNITQTIKMKLMVFEYYNRFYKHVYDEKDYEKKRPQVYRFFLDAAKDGTVPPAIFPNAKRLGDERSSANYSAAAGGSILAEFYRNRKLLERYLEVAAIQNDLLLEDVILLRYISQSDGTHTRKTIADFLGVSVRTVSLTLQRLLRKNLIKITEIKNSRSDKRRIQITLLPAADSVLPDLQIAENDFNLVKFDGFSEEELQNYRKMLDRIKENILEVLS